MCIYLATKWNEDNSDICLLKIGVYIVCLYSIVAWCHNSVNHSNFFQDFGVYYDQMLQASIIIERHAAPNGTYRRIIVSILFLLIHNYIWGPPNMYLGMTIENNS